MGAGFLELEEIDEADFGIFGGVVEDLGAGEERPRNDRCKKKRKRKRKRGDGDQGPSGDDHGDLIVEDEHEGGKKGKKTPKTKRRGCKKEKVKDEVKSADSDEDVADDNAEGS